MEFLRPLSLGMWQPLEVVRRSSKRSGVSDSADGDGNSGSSIGGGQHVAAAVEDSARVNDHAGGMYFARYDTLGLNLDAAFGENYAVEAAGDDDAVSLDLSLDFGTLTKHHGLLRDDVALDVAVDAERPRHLQGAFDCHALIDKAGPLFVASGIRTAGPLPSHDNPRTKTLLL